LLVVILLLLLFAAVTYFVRNTVSTARIRSRPCPYLTPLDPARTVCPRNSDRPPHVYPSAVKGNRGPRWQYCHRVQIWAIAPRMDHRCGPSSIPFWSTREINRCTVASDMFAFRNP
jgi:hypothetical protein